jgi:hypothetical protein
MRFRLTSDLASRNHRRDRRVTTIVRMNSNAQFLVLAGAAPRALLFDSEQNLLGEVIEDDGFIVDTLLDAAVPCPMPGSGMLDLVVPPPPVQDVRCFALGQAPAHGPAHATHAPALAAHG